MARSVDLEISTQRVDNIHAYGIFRVKIRAHNPVEMSKDIFVYRKEPMDEFNGEVADTCTGVCSPCDFSEYPVGAPDPARSQPFFRKDYLIADFRSSKTAYETVEKIKQQVLIMIEGLNAADELVVADDVTIGG